MFAGLLRELQWEFMTMPLNIFPTEGNSGNLYQVINYFRFLGFQLVQ